MDGGVMGVARRSCYVPQGDIYLREKKYVEAALQIRLWWEGGEGGKQVDL